MRLVVYPYKMGSESARALANNIDGIRVRSDGRYRYRRGDIIINWGSSTLPPWMTPTAYAATLNKPDKVHHSANKIRCFEKLGRAGVAIPEWTTSRDVAIGWNAPLYARHLIGAHSGNGVEVVPRGFNVPVAPLYTRAIYNAGEYRVHVFRGEVIDYRKKMRRQGDTPASIQSLVRSHGNGWVFVAHGIRRLERVEELAVRAIRAMELDFGAVDIIMDVNGVVRVLEVNSACGLDETTLSNYTNSILHYAIGFGTGVIYGAGTRFYT